jgi:hypothetical protein
MVHFRKMAVTVCIQHKQGVAVAVAYLMDWLEWIAMRVDPGYVDVSGTHNVMVVVPEAPTAPIWNGRVNTSLPISCVIASTGRALVWWVTAPAICPSFSSWRREPTGVYKGGRNPAWLVWGWVRQMALLPARCTAASIKQVAIDWDVKRGTPWDNPPLLSYPPATAGDIDLMLISDFGRSTMYQQMFVFTKTWNPCLPG